MKEPPTKDWEAAGRGEEEGAVLQSEANCIRQLFC